MKTFIFHSSNVFNVRGYSIIKIQYLILISFLLLSNISFAQWELKNNGISGVATAWAIDAIDSNVAVAVYSKEIFITEDAGSDWLNITPNDSFFVDASMSDKSNIWVVNGYGKIYFTNDGGINWTLQFYTPSKTRFINYIEMFDVNNGVAMGDANGDGPTIFLKTTNGGFTWTSVNNNFLLGGASNNLWRQIDFIDMNTGYFGALPFNSNTFSDEVWKTIDGGQTWVQTNQGVSPQILKFYNIDIGIIFTFGPTLRTFDGLNTVDTISNITAFNPSDIEYFPGNPSKIFYLNSDRLFFSNDSGKNWEVVFRPSNGLWGKDIVLTTDKSGWIISDAGNVYYNANIDIITDVKKEENTIPKEFILSQNYPNPFNPTTTISYSIPKGSFVTLTIYDVLGKEVKTLVNRFLSVGKYNVTFNASNLTSGVYIYSIKAGNFTVSKKLVLMK